MGSHVEVDHIKSFQPDGSSNLLEILYVDSPKTGYSQTRAVARECHGAAGRFCEPLRSRASQVVLGWDSNPERALQKPSTCAYYPHFGAIKVKRRRAALRLFPVTLYGPLVAPREPSPFPFKPHEPDQSSKPQPCSLTCPRASPHAAR